ncbi:histidine kinase dimerization/phospho-acceptor domain-containing protein [Kribbella qitaiheensis]|uniref:histidine kinase dimerization/phospho-acceptor domain-containing protein n=1 Tax=Kribbella qitaiheensis TaxID=1544730 RepID=UPI001FEB9962|nr:histidine kinase dimerization/phospho-acceptor domain-containing protein [Kribbella qitaiheensis]
MPTRRLADRYPLRITIVLVLLALVTAALLASGLVATTIMRGYLVDRVDSQLVKAATPLQHSPRDAFGPRHNPGARPRLPSLFVVQFNDSEGTKVGNDSAPLGETEPAPNLPALNLNQIRNLGGKPFDTGAVSGSATWRVLALPLDSGTGSVIVAQSLGELDQTIERLIGIQAATGLILLVLLAGVGTYVVRRSLRGLEDVEHTAVAIAGGDLSRRVPQRDPRTEVGRLSLALNQMLGQIETAFRQRTASEFAARKSEDAARRSEEVARHSEESARQSEERMRRFIADASHELRTPLTSIRGFAELTRQRGSAIDPTTMKRIEDEAKRMGLLVDDLLLLARLDQQRPLQHQPVDLLTLAGDSVHDVQAVQPGPGR